jgi:23S rRNA (adenine2503-C2)-methyltransferase
MKVLQRLKVPTGDILIVEGEKGKLELLSLGDYGKDVNLKADCMGLTRDIPQVEHQKMLPLSKKWVITISTQYGCSMGCTFCDVPKVGPGINATACDMYNEIRIGLALHPEIKEGERLNVHFARMGEPTWNPDVLTVGENAMGFGHFRVVHPVVSTMMPWKNVWLEPFLYKWLVDIKNNLYNGDAGLQISVNSTNYEERQKMFNGNAMPLNYIGQMLEYWPKPRGRKITLNFAIANYTIDAKYLRSLFNPEKFVCKLTPMHKTLKAIENGIETKGDYTSMYPYKEVEENLKAEGFDVLVFIASKEEDLGRITCGNAILSGTLPEVPFEVIK